MQIGIIGAALAAAACVHSVTSTQQQVETATRAAAGGWRMLDLTAVARGLLARAGVTEVESADLCTSCNPELFYSHRRDGERTGRQAGLAWMV